MFEIHCAPLVFSAFIHRPQDTLLRRALFQIHLWSGLTLALYVLAVSASGSVLVFRHELEAWFYPQLYEAGRGDQPLAAPETVLRNVEAAYPGYRVGTINWPSPDRDTFVSYPARPGDVRTVFAHPVTGEVIGELPATGFVQWIRELHVYLLIDRGTGLRANGVLSGVLGIMCLTGLVLWWPGVSRWTRGLFVDFRRGWRRVTFDLHNALGFWTAALLVLWAVSGVYLTFPRQFRAAVSSISPLGSSVAAPQSDPSSGVEDAAPSTLVASAVAHVPGSSPARFSRPASPRGAAVVLVAQDVVGDRVTSDEVTVYLDRSSGRILEVRPEVTSAGDLFMAWLFPLHAGWFGGIGVKLLWALLGLVYPVLAVTGAIMWWNRIRPRESAQQAA